MKVILQKDMEGLGHLGDVVKVSDGYAVNFLLPRGIAAIADEKNVAQLDHLRRMAAQKRKRQLVEAQKEADSINGTAISIRRATGEGDKLFGSVTNRDIADALEAEGIKVDKRAIVLDEPIKSIGVYTIPVKIHAQVEAKLKVYVIRE